MFADGVLMLGPVRLHVYGLLIGLGVWLGYRVVQVGVERYRLVSLFYRERLESALLWGFIGGVVGARLYHVVDWWSYYAHHWGEIVAVWQGGLGIYGGVIGGMLGLLLYCFGAVKPVVEHRGQWWAEAKKAWLTFADLGAIGLPLGQAVGRLGNYFNQELYGLPVRAGWEWLGIAIKPENRVVGFEQVELFHPLFFYESGWNLLVFLGLWWGVRRTRSRWIGTGLLLAAYLFCYSLGRFWLEFLRIEPWALVFQGVEVTVAQLVALGLMISSGLWWFVVRLRGR